MNRSTKVRRLFALLVKLAGIGIVGFWAGSSPAGTAGPAATAIYVDGDAPRDGVGTAQSPFNKLASLQAAIYRSSMRGVTSYLAGTFHGEKLSVQQGMTNCELKQWPGKPQAVVRGDTIIRDEWEEDVPGMRYSVPIGPETDVVGVVEDWDVRVDWQGRHFGHLTRVADTSAVEATEGTWFYDGARLNIHAINDENPNHNGRKYGWGIGGNAFYLLSAQYTTVEGLHFKLWLDPDPGEGYGVYMGGAEHCVIRDCLANDYGYHGFGFVGLGCRFNTFDHCVTRGGRRANGSTAYIFYAFTDPGGTIDGCRAYDCEAHLYRHLNVRDQPPPYAPNLSADGFYIHANGAMITDVEYHRCVAYGYENRNGYGFAFGEPSAVPTDPSDPETYPVRFYDCRLVNGVTNDINGGTSGAFVRCSFDMRRMVQVVSASSAAFNTYFQMQPTRILFESCEFKFNTDGLPWTTCFNVTDGVAVNLRGCVLYDDGQGTSPVRSFVRYAGSTASVSASQTVFAHRTPQRLTMTNTPWVTPPAEMLLRDCWYWNILPLNGYSSNPALDSQPEFEAVIDPGGIFAVNPQFAAAPTDLEGAPGGAMASTVLVIPGVDRQGINMLNYDGHYGAYQYGPACPADLDGSGAVDGADLANLLAAWGTPPLSEAADLTIDGSVDGRDLAELLASWGPCR